MLLKITDSWGPGIAYLAVAVITLAAIGLAAILAGIVLLVVRLFRRKERKQGQANARVQPLLVIGAACHKMSQGQPSVKRTGGPVLSRSRERAAAGPAPGPGRRQQGENLGGHGVKG